MGKIIEISNLKKKYGKKTVLDNFDFSIDRGEMVTICGKSGCGKSTFLNIVGLLDKPTEGEYLFDGKPVLNNINRMQNIRAHKIGFVFQAYCLLDNLSVMDNIMMPFLYNELKIDKNVKLSIDEYMEKFGLSELANKKVKYLSGGEKQRVSVLRALAKDPSIIVADEPTGNLDPENSEIIFRELKSIACRNKSVIVVTHDENTFVEVDKRYRLHDGKLENE